MASQSSYLPRLSLGGNTSSISPTNHRHGKSNDYDLSELSPRPSSPLLSPDHVHDFGFQDSNTYSSHGSGSSSARKGKAKAVAYADQVEVFPPVSVVDRMRMQRESQAAARGREGQVTYEAGLEQSAPAWLPSSSADHHDNGRRSWSQQVSSQPRQSQHQSQSQGRNLGASFMGFLKPGPSTVEYGSAGDVDHTFRAIQRREKQIQKELQRLLDAQAYALEHGEVAGNTSEDGSNTPQGTSRGSSPSYQAQRVSSYDGSPVPAVIPVRQPKSQPPTVRQVRTSIARSIAMLSDLKEEESSYIASAVSVRENALARVNKLSNQHKTIAAELRALEKDGPLRTQLETMGKEYSKVCTDIEEYEGKLRALKHQKRVLESRVEEVKSERESGLSGYRNALRETERDIGEIMRVPGVAILPMEEEEDSQVSGISENNVASQDGLLQRALNGHDFIRMRPERRTIAMAKEWWEGEMALLLRRRGDVNKERQALFAGSETWAETIQIIVDYERRLSVALSDSIQVRATERHKLEAAVFRAQYQDLQQTIREIEGKLHHVEERGWNLLVAAIGAELDGFIEGEKILAELMKAKGHELPVEPGPVEAGDGQSTQQDARRSSAVPEPEAASLEDGLEDELTGSVVRRWGGQSETESSPRLNDGKDVLRNSIPLPTSTRADDNGNQEYKEESDNEVPADLLVSERHLDESEDEQTNEVPSEFLSMHDSLRRNSEKQVGEQVINNEVPRDLLGESSGGERDGGVD